LQPEQLHLTNNVDLRFLPKEIAINKMNNLNDVKIHFNNQGA